MPRIPLPKLLSLTLRLPGLEEVACSKRSLQACRAKANEEACQVFGGQGGTRDASADSADS